jgi:cytoskeletal protein RodZ
MDSAGIGKILQAAREANGLTLDQSAGDTHIRLRYLQALEAGDFEALPSRFQVRGFLRVYADYLGLDVDEMLRLLDGKPAPDSAHLAEEKSAETPPEPAAEPAPMSVSTPMEPPAPEKEPPPPPVAEPVPVKETPPSPKKPADPRFAEIGQTLRDQREILGLSLDDVERHTHLRVRYLKALEDGDLDGLPSPVQGRGMLKNYAEFLGLNPDDLLLTYADGLQANFAERRSQTAQPRPAAKAPSEPPAATRKHSRLLSRDFFFAVVLVIGLLAFGIWGGLRIAEIRDTAEATVPTPPSIADVLLPPPSATLEPTATATVLAAIEEAIVTPNPANPQETPGVVLTPVGPVGPVRVEIVVRQRAYLRVVVDEEVKFDGRVLAGTVYSFAGDKTIEILTGSGSALQVSYNEQDLGVLGTYGEAVDFVVTVDGVQTPTPTITPTPTETPTPAVTPTPNS